REYRKVSLLYRWNPKYESPKVMTPVRATVSGAPLITRAFATTRSIIPTRTPCCISDLAYLMAASALWLTRKTRMQAYARFHYRICELWRSSEEQMRESAKQT